MFKNTGFLLYVLIIFAPLFAAQPARSAGFAQGNTIRIDEYRGVLHVSCPRESVSVLCRAYSAEPGTADYFVGDPGLKADQVTLVSTWESGKVRKKKLKYEEEENRTRSPVNLLNETLFQRALLGFGVNQIEYRFTNAGEAVSEGVIEARVEDGEILGCRTGYLRSHDSNDCRAPHRLCREYFARYERTCEKEDL